MTGFSTTGAVMYLIFAIIIIWETSLLMIERKKITIFLPFLFISVVFCFYAAFTFFDVFRGNAGLVLESMRSVSLIWIMVNFIRKGNGDK